ncbi:hypothetical protein [Ferroplasma sp.]|uniref:hypothetical protein n=1 Tax=Ferroplasma sp. TaxID=2591003 RepID=UPI00262597AE|nr:hypothetical protein [Ferroplasma sp.]
MIFPTFRLGRHFGQTVRFHDVFGGTHTGIVAYDGKLVILEREYKYSPSEIKNFEVMQ